MTATDGPPPRRDYNPIFEELVDTPEGDQARLQGLLAYSLYKESKREWAAGIRKRNGRGPTEEELAAYIETWTPTRLDGVRGEAAQILAAYANFVVATEEPRILREAAKGSFRRSFWSSFWATLFFAVLLAVLGIILVWQNVDVLGTAGRALVR